MKQSKPFFSIIIPTLNEEKYLPKLLQDLAKQTFRDFEVIVADGNSVDKTVREAKTYAKKLPKLQLIISQKRSASYQRNLGASKAKGEYIVFLDADDRLPVYFIEGIKYRLLVTDAEIFTTWCEVDSDNSSDKVVGQIMNLAFELGRLVEQPVGSASMIGISNKGFQKVGGFREDLTYAEDEAFLRAARKLGLHYEIFKDPRYVYSLRRLRKGKKLTVFRRFAKLQFKKLMKIPIDQSEYQMGGSYHLNGSGLKHSAFDLQKNLERLLRKPKSVRKRLLRLLETLGEELE